MRYIILILATLTLLSCDQRRQAIKRIERTCYKFPDICNNDTTVVEKRFRDTTTIIKVDTVYTVDSLWEVKKKKIIDSLFNLRELDTIIINRGGVYTRIIRVDSSQLHIYQELTDSMLSVIHKLEITIDKNTTIKDSLEREITRTKLIVKPPKVWVYLLYLIAITILIGLFIRKLNDKR